MIRGKQSQGGKKGFSPVIRQKEGEGGLQIKIDETALGKEEGGGCQKALDGELATVQSWSSKVQVGRVTLGG